MLTASIVLYKTSKSELESFARSIQTDIIQKLYVVDNSPTNELKSFVEENFPGCEYIFSNQNLGYGGANNIAIEKAIEAGSTFHLIANTDLSFDPSILSELLREMEERKAILISPKIYFPDGELQYTCRLLPSPGDLFIRRFFPFMRDGKKVKRHELRFTHYNITIDVPFLSGCFMMVRTETLQKVGGFDPRFFLYAEDMDLCRRLHMHGSTLFYPEVSIVHKLNRKSYTTLKFTIIHIRSAIQYFNKWGWYFDKQRKEINQRAIRRLTEN